MFYTSILTSLLPYILLFGVFGTLLINRIAFYTNKEEKELKHILLQEEKALEDVSVYYYYETVDARHDKGVSAATSDKGRIGNLIPYPLSVLTRVNVPMDISSIFNPGLNTTYSFRGPPSCCLLSS